MAGGAQGSEVPGVGSVWLADSITELDEAFTPTVVACGSHGGLFPARVAARWGVRGVAFNDAGVGLEAAGIAGLRLLAGLGTPAVAVSHLTARIGDARDTLERGRVSHLNHRAAALGCEPGMSAAESLDRMLDGERLQADVPEGVPESRRMVAEGACPVWALDSASLVRPSDIGAVVVTGSHGGLLGGRPKTALGVDALAAVFNDAGGGADDAGFGRLPALDTRGIAAATVSAGSARIGDGLSTYHDGVISAVNDVARRAGAQVGMPCAEFVERVIGGRP